MVSPAEGGAIFLFKDRARRSRSVSGLLYFVLPTGECNLNCAYCGGSFPKERVPWSVGYGLHHLKGFLGHDPDPTVAFYGGEPLLNSGFIEEVMGAVRARYVIQTNGTLIDRLSPECWSRMDAVLLSIDGRRETTDFYRGAGVYGKVERAAKALREWGFRGDLIARMAVSERTDIYRDVIHLIGSGLFDHVHWQLDVGWSQGWEDFDRWCSESYKPGIRRLARTWEAAMEGGRILGLVPFLGILKRIREGGPLPPCGSGSEAFAIMPDGVIRACPISFDTGWAASGDVRTDTPATITRCGITGECLLCGYLRVCGGRCLYMNRERLWGEEGFRKVCDLTKYIIDEVGGLRDSVERLAREGRIDARGLDYPPYNNSTEIIP